MPPRTSLSIGASAVSKVVMVVVALFMTAFAVGVGLAAYGFAYATDTVVTSSGAIGEYHVDKDGKLVPGPPGDPEFVGGIGAAVGGAGMLCSLLFLGLVVFLLLRTWRTAGWLEGSVLNVRGALKTKSQDLATASISGGSQLQQVGAGESRTVHRVQTLVATDPASGRSVTLPLRGAGLAILPGDQLMMLANAITNQRVRSGPDDMAFIVADRLRELARDPFA